MENPPKSDGELLFPSMEAPVASTSGLSPPSTPPRHHAQGRPVSPRGPLVPQETLAVRRFKAAARLSPTLGSRPRTRSADDLASEATAESCDLAATAGLGLQSDRSTDQDDEGLQMSIRPARYDAALQQDVPHTAPPVASSSLSSTSPFGSSFKFPSASPRPPSSLSSDSSAIPAPKSPLRLSLAALSPSLPSADSSSDPKGKAREVEQTPTASEVPGVLLRAASEDAIPVVNGSEQVVKAKSDPAALGGEPSRNSPARSSAKPRPSPPVCSPSYKPALPSPLSTSHTSATSADGLGPAMRRPIEEFPFPPSPSTPHFTSSSGTPRAVSPSPSTPIGRTPPQNGDNPLPSSHAALPRHLQHSSPPRASERIRSQSNDFHSSPPRAPTTPGHWRSSSSSVTSSPHHVYASPEPAPLTPPESSGTGRHLTSAADLAWNDVLGPIGALSFSGIDFSLGESRDGSGKSSIPQVDDLMALEDETPAPVRMTPGTNGGGGGGVGAVGAATSNTGTPNGSNERIGNEALMLGSGGGHFGPSTRERLATLIERHLPKVPLAKEDEVVHIVEYGALNSRSSSLVPPIISQLAARHAALSPSDSSASSSSSHADDTDSLSFQVTHADKVGSDFRALSQMLESNSDSSYLNPSWLAAQELENRVFSAFASRPFASKVLPRSSVSFGFSAMALHWLSTDRKYHMPPSTLAHGELMAFLSSRATEFKPGGLLAMAYIARSESTPAPTTPAASAALQHVLQRGASTNSSASPNATNGGSLSNPGTPGVSAEPMRPTLRERAISSPAVPLLKKRDIWDLLSGILGKAIQRIVSTNLLKPSVARLLLALPIHPRTPRQTQAVLRAMQHSWTVEEEEIIVLSHPAWRGLEHKTVSPASYSDHTMQLLKIFYESTMRSILRDALESRAACEWILECLWTVAKEKVDEEGPQPLELEVQIVALRRKGPETSTATA